MSQNDLVVANDTNPNVRADINSAFQAQATGQSGATAPSTSYVYQEYNDTTNGVKKRKDSTNTSYDIIDTLSSARTPAKTAAYSVVVGDMNKTILCNATSTSFTVTLPAAATAGIGFRIVIKKTDSSTNTVTVAGTIDGVTNFVLNRQNQSVYLICDGSNWHIISDVDKVPFFKANANGGQTLTTATLTKIQFGTTAFDTHGWYDAATNYRYTPLKAGKYLVIARAQLNDTTTTGARKLEVQKNGSSIGPFFFTPSGIAPSGFYATTIIMNGTTDYLEVFLEQNSGVNKVLYTGNTNEFSALYMGE